MDPQSPFLVHRAHKASTQLSSTHIPRPTCPCPFRSCTRPLVVLEPRHVGKPQASGSGSQMGSQME